MQEILLDRKTSQGIFYRIFSEEGREREREREPVERASGERERERVDRITP